MCLQALSLALLCLPQGIFSPRTDRMLMFPQPSKSRLPRGKQQQVPLSSHWRRRTIKAYGLRKQVLTKVHAKLRAAKERGVQVKHLLHLREQLRPVYW